MNRFGLVSIWVAVTALTSLLAWQIVAAAGEQVSPGPLTPIAAPVTSTTGVSTTLPTTTSSPVASTSTTQPGTAATTSATTPSSASTSTSVAVGWQVKTIPTAGGTIVVSYRPGEVILDGATPAAGFTVDVDKQGPPDVKVKFESESTHVEIRVEWGDKLVVDVQEDGEEGED
ncbi:MAG: hypothetical protein WEE53_05145 [Acidimicrobiia bacterium]